MSTQHEIETKILAAQDHMVKRIDKMNVKTNAMLNRYAKEVEALHKMPLWRDNWEPQRSLRVRKCSITGKTIWPGQKVYSQKTFWGLANDDVNKPEVEISWATPEAVTFEKLKL